ncbi:hypothetical protein Trco_002052 [Trichoderma cornu-damae]|uniref:Uncharacterized protein n=1 Tax=Trichoderma cornu-damae TaxID=654480 RepID=A0A9P8TUN9_9HYPO|nr:hypothetical protein Trco_002052 [Trichoderma cornu-damae]
MMGETEFLDANVLELLHPSLSLLGGKGRRNLLEDGLKGLLLSAVLGKLTADEQVDGVALVGSLSALLPPDAEDALVEAHPPVVGLVAGEAGAVDARLLAGAEADDLAVDGVADGVALGIFEGDGGDGEVAGGALGEGSGVLGSDDGAERPGGDLGVVAVLLEADAVDGPGLDGAGVVVRVDLEDEVLASLLLPEDLQSGVLVAGGNDAVGDLLGDDAGGGNVHNVAEGDDVAEAAHAVGAAGASVGLGERRAVDAVNVVDKVDLLLVIREREPDGGASRGNVLETGGGRLAQRLLELLDEGPRVEGVEEVDVSGRAAQDLERQRLVGGVSGGGLLVRVGAVPEGHVLVSRARLAQEASVVVGVAEDGDPLVVLGGGADQSHAANVNLLDGLGDADVDLGNGILEGVQVADDIVNLVDVLVGEVLLNPNILLGKTLG